MTKATVQEAMGELPALIERVRNGEVVLISDGDEVLVRLEPVFQQIGPRTPGSMKDKLIVPARLLEPLTDHELEQIWGKENV
jgi:antitoxin (DNA-binding transcriptional repressor) of toxin-antitoxin stability system